MLQGRTMGSKGLVFKNCLISNKVREHPKLIVGWMIILPLRSGGRLGSFMSPAQHSAGHITKIQ